MIILGRPELGRRDDLGDDRTWPLLLRTRFGALRGVALLFIVVENRGAILRSAIVALLIDGRRIVQAEKMIEDLVEGDLRRIEFDLQRLGVAGAAGLHIFVGRLRKSAAGVTDGRVDHTGQLAEQLLDTPEASACECRCFGHLCASCFPKSGRYWP